MALSRLGDYIELVEGKNNDGQFGINNIKGISTKKEFIKTKANMDGISLSGYKIVYPLCFAYVADTSRRGDKISLAFNDTDEVILVSSITTVFRVKPKVELLPRYLYMYFNRPEFDRYSRFNSWGSAREAFGWEDMCDIEIDIPPIEVQQKVVDVYLAMVANQKVYEKGLDDLKLTCDLNIQEYMLDKKNYSRLGNYIERSFVKNTDFRVNKLIGVGKNGFIEPKQSKDETNGHICYLVYKKDFVFAPPQLHVGSIDLYEGDETVKCSDAYIVFKVIDNKILDKYLKMYLLSPFFQKYCLWNREGVREQFDFEQLAETSIPIPPLKVQKSIIEIFDVFEIRKKINENLKKQINEICPVLIKGSIDLNK